MDFYFGVDLLLRLKKHYESRLSLAIAKGFYRQYDRYHWLFTELQYRVSILRRTLALLDALPDFMCHQSEEQIFAIVIGYTMPWFSEDTLGKLPHDEDGSSPYFDNRNPYYADYQASLDRFQASYDFKQLATFYIDLVECLVMAVRMYFFIRERQFKPIDRESFADLVGIKAVLPAPA